MKRKPFELLLALLLCLVLLIGCGTEEQIFSVDLPTDTQQTEQTQESGIADIDESLSDLFSLEQVPSYSGEAYVEVNGNIPFFTDDEITNHSFEWYRPLDSLGRCSVAFACVGKNLMPTEERGSIGQVKPSGWHIAKYDCVDGKYLYNRCHLIGYQLTAENANERNLITGTRYLNIEGMLPFENFIADYVQHTNNHVLYRVTPIFEKENLLCSGVLMEGYSVEDKGAGICFCVYAYNVQPGVQINYVTGESSLAAEIAADPADQTPIDTETEPTYILNTNTHKFHRPDCSSVDDIKSVNREKYSGSRKALIEQGYKPCKRCLP